jgi:hypothetical protein
MGRTFAECQNLVNAPDIPNSVTNMHDTFYNCHNLTTAPNIGSGAINVRATFRLCENLTGNIFVHSTNVNDAYNFVDGTSLEKDIYIPLTYANGVNTSTYNAFVAQGYSTTARKNGALLKDINTYVPQPNVPTEPTIEEQLVDYTYMVVDNVATVTNYTGVGGDIILPTTLIK